MPKDRAVTTAVDTKTQDMQVAQGPQTLDTPTHLTLRARSSNFNMGTSRHHIGGVDAQGVYPPTACVFVAKYEPYLLTAVNLLT